MQNVINSRRGESVRQTPFPSSPRCSTGTTKARIWRLSCICRVALRARGQLRSQTVGKRVGGCGRAIGDGRTSCPGRCALPRTTAETSGHPRALGSLAPSYPKPPAPGPAPVRKHTSGQIYELEIPHGVRIRNEIVGETHPSSTVLVTSFLVMQPVIQLCVSDAQQTMIPGTSRCWTSQSVRDFGLVQGS